MNKPAILVTGAAGFIGRKIVDAFLSRGEHVIGVDNLSWGNRDAVERIPEQGSFEFIEADLSDANAFRSLENAGRIGEVWHLAANSGIPAGGASAHVDFRDTFLTTFNTLSFMKETGIGRIVFASSSAVYGDNPKLLTEDTGPLFPISNYGAMKLASEASISAAVESFVEHAWIMRLPNVVGPQPTHGIIHDLIKKLTAQPAYLEVLGDGLQQKSYMHLSEVVEAMFFIRDHTLDSLNYFNVGPEDTGVTVRFIADAVVATAAPELPIRYTGNRKGWSGDVPKFQYSVEKLKQLGWSPKMSSAQAVERAVTEVHREFFPPCS